MASSVLVLGACEPMQMLLTKCLAANQHDVVVAEDVTVAERALGGVPPDIILANVSDTTPPALFAGLRELNLASTAPQSAPVIMLDRDATPARRVSALASGARDLLAWPLNQRLLLARLRGVLREVHAAREVERRETAAAQFGLGNQFNEGVAEFAPRRSVAFVAAPERGSRLDDIDTQSLGAAIKRLTPEEAISGAGNSAPVDTFVVDGTNLSMSSAFNTLPELRARAHSRHAAILFIHDPDDPDIAASALDSGASDILASDALPEELVHRIHALLLRKQEEDALRRSSENSLKLAVTDSLTGLYNRRYAEIYLQDALSNAEGGTSLTAMIIDIDHFKRINDTHGHSVGDTVLKEVARRMRATLRSIDMVARYGGEEFIVVLPGTEMAQAGPAADRLRRNVGGMPIPIGDDRSVRVTVSIGVSVGDRETPQKSEVFASKNQNSETSRNVARLLEAADKALYFAKETGRNRIKVAEASA